MSTTSKPQAQRATAIVATAAARRTLGVVCALTAAVVAACGLRMVADVRSGAATALHLDSITGLSAVAFAPRTSLESTRPAAESGYRNHKVEEQPWSEFKSGKYITGGGPV